MFMQFTLSVLIVLYCQNHFFTSYQQKETGEITINQESDLVRDKNYNKSDLWKC
jgi:hypothetical protein